LRGSASRWHSLAVSINSVWFPQILKPVTTEVSPQRITDLTAKICRRKVATSFQWQPRISKPYLLATTA